MRLDFLLKKINWSSTNTYGKPIDGSEDLFTCQLYFRGQMFFDATSLYFSSTHLLPGPDQPENFIVLCYGKPIDWSQYADSNFTLIYLAGWASFQAIFNTVQKIFSNEQQLAVHMQTLLDALLSEKGLQHIIDTAAQIFGNPLYVVDLQHKYLAISSGNSQNNEFLERELKSGYISGEGITMIEQSGLDEKIRRNGKPYLFDNKLDKQCMLIDIVLIQGIEVGHIMLQEFNHPYGENDDRLLRHLSQLVAMELQKDDIFTNNKGVMYSYFLADILKNPGINSSYIHERLTMLGFTLKEELYMLVMPPPSYISSKLRLEIIVEQIHYIIHGSLYVLYENAIVFLVSRDKHKGLSSYEVEKLDDFLRVNNLKLGVSNYFTKLSDAAKFYKQARDAVKFSIKFSDTRSLCYFSDYYIYQMLHACEKDDPNIQYLIQPGLMQLYEYDAEKSTDFLTTLYEYIMLPNQPAQVAANLHIHKNTLLYRMGKIKEITSCSFEKGDDFLAFNLSFKILKYLNMY